MSAVQSEADPERLDELLVTAFGSDEFGATGRNLEGHRVVTEADVQAVLDEGAGSSLLYGELLPTSCNQLLEALSDSSEVDGPILELGMGTGKVALHLFLTSKRDVYGVELAHSRWQVADTALQRIAKADGLRYNYVLLRDGASQLTDAHDGRKCDFISGSMLDTPTNLVADASAVVLQVCLPHGPQLQVCEILRQCQPGCRVVCYAPLHGAVKGCRLAPCAPQLLQQNSRLVSHNADSIGVLRMQTSWSTKTGHAFSFYQIAETAEKACAAVAVAAGCDRKLYDGVSTGHPQTLGGSNCDELLGSTVRSEGSIRYSEGQEVLVAYSFLPLFDLGGPGDGIADWYPGWVTRLLEDGRVDILYSSDGTVEEAVHPLRVVSASDKASA